MSTEPRQHAPPRGDAPPRRKQRARDAAQLRIAALLSSHPPLRSGKLAADPALQLRTELLFEPIAPPAAAGAATPPPSASFGLLHCGYLPRGVVDSAIAVKRGRWGSKPAEQLYVLQPMPAELLAQPALRQRGTLRALHLALADVQSAAPPAAPTQTELWLAVELVLNGSVDAARLREFANAHGSTLPSTGKGGRPGLVESGGLLVWRKHLQRGVLRLVEVLKQAKQRNPLRTELSETQAAALLGDMPPAVARALLEELAGQFKLRKAHGAYPLSYALSGDLAPAPATTDELASIKAIRQQLELEPGAGKRSMAAKFPSQLNVLAWLYDAETLVELPGWYTVTREQLRKYLKQLAAGPGQPVPSVRDIKDKLGLGRREAEALRAWYAAQNGVPPVGPAEPRGAR